MPNTSSLKLVHVSTEELQNTVLRLRSRLEKAEAARRTPPLTGSRSYMELRGMRSNINMLRNLLRYREQALVERAALECNCGAMSRVAMQ